MTSSSFAANGAFDAGHVYDTNAPMGLGNTGNANANANASASANANSGTVVYASGGYETADAIVDPSLYATVSKDNGDYASAYEMHMACTSLSFAGDSRTQSKGWWEMACHSMPCSNLTGVLPAATATARCPSARHWWVALF